eukprot:364418-Chlamydomonas_euryale.AAC.3
MQPINSSISLALSGFQYVAMSHAGESMADPLLYFHNITATTIGLLRAMQRADVHKVGRSRSDLYIANAR